VRLDGFDGSFGGPGLANDALLRDLSDRESSFQISVHSADSRPLHSNRVGHSCGDNTCGNLGIRCVDFMLMFVVESDVGGSW
jgi:hypothetical protein